MGKCGCGVVLAASLTAICLSQAHAQGMSAAGVKVELASDRPVYNLRSPAGVKVTLTNGSSQPVFVPPWEIYNQEDRDDLRNG